MTQVNDGELAYLTPEAKARVEIDAKLAASGWTVQDARAVNLAAARGVAVREFMMKSPHGRADYLLFLGGAAAGVIEAKKEGEMLTGVEWQSAKYVDGLPDEIPTAVEGALPFVYESTGVETHFTNTLDPDAASREVFSFHRPETLARRLEEIARHPTAPTLRHRLRTLPPLAEAGLWSAQVTAIRNLEESLAAGRPRALIQMATGSGKTFTAANVAYRLVKHADARRILFLVDRANLGRQTLKELQGFTTPDDGRAFRWLSDRNAFDPHVTGSTIKHLPQEDLRQIVIPVPPLDEQRRIVAEVEERLSAIDALRAAMERAQRRSAVLRRAVLERAFRGELVPQDTSDEPAEALLARIGAERETEHGPARRHRRTARE